MCWSFDEETPLLEFCAALLSTQGFSFEMDGGDGG